MEQQSQSYEQQNLYQRIRSRQGDYESRRSQYDDQRDVICELLRPDLVKGQVGSKTEGAFEGSAIVEGTGPYAALVWQRGFMGSMVTKKAEWFRSQLEEPPRASGVKFKGNDEVNAYLQDLTDHMVNRYKRSNYYDVMPEFTLNGGTVGSPVMLYQYDVARDFVICEVPDYAAVWLDKDVFGRDNSLHVKRTWTALQAEEFFGYQQLPLVVQQQLRNGQHYAESEYLQCIYGAGDRIYKGIKDVRQSHPWLEHFICLGAAGEAEQHTLKPLHKGPGYFSRPFSTWHYHRNWHEIYGRTMAWWAIYDVRGHNAMWEALFGEAELALRPPTWAMGALQGRLNLAPGGSNWANNASEYQNPPLHLERKTRYDIGIDFADRLAAAVRRHFHSDLFMPVASVMDTKTQPETVYALMKAEAEKTAQLAPQVETYEGQVLSDTFDVFVDIERMAEPAYPWGRLPEPPAIVQQFSDGQVSPQFIGQLSMAMVRDRQVNKFFRNIGMAEQIIMLEPRLVNKVRWADVLEGVLETGDFPQSWIVPAEMYDKVIEAIDQRAMQQEMAESMPKMTQAAKNLQGKTEKGSPLAMMTGAPR